MEYSINQKVWVCPQGGGTRHRGIITDVLCDMYDGQPLLEALFLGERKLLSPANVTPMKTTQK